MLDEVDEALDEALEEALDKVVGEVAGRSNNPIYHHHTRWLL